jgi:hypothetical protein
MVSNRLYEAQAEVERLVLSLVIRLTHRGSVSLEGAVLPGSKRRLPAC